MVKRRFSILGWNRVSVMLQLQKAIHELVWGKAVTLKQNSPAFIRAETPAILCFLLNPLGNYCAHLAKASHDIPSHRVEHARTQSSTAWGLFYAVSHSLLLATSAVSTVPEQPLWQLVSHWPCPVLKQARKNRGDVADHNLWPKGKVFRVKMIDLLIGDKNCFSASKLPGSSYSGVK